MEFLKLENWLNIWGGIILIGMPLLFAFATFIYKRRKSLGEGILPPQIMRLLLVPFLTFYLILNKTIGIDRSLLGLKILETIITIILVSFLFNAINYLFFSKNNILTKKELIPKLGRDVLHFIFIIIISASAMSNIWGLDVGNLFTALGVSSIVIGLALQEPLGNLFNGISLLMAKPFHRGDWISVNEEIGKVKEINWRSVKIHTRFNEEIIIPNNLLSKEKIKNLSKPNKIYAVLISIGFSYNDPPEKVKEVLFNIVKENKKVLPIPLPLAHTLSFDDFYISYGIRFYVRDYEDSILLKDEIMTNIYAGAMENNLTIPDPRQELDVKMIKE